MQIRARIPEIKGETMDEQTKKLIDANQVAISEIGKEIKAIKELLLDVANLCSTHIGKDPKIMDQIKEMRHGN